MQDLTLTRRRTTSFVIANASALLVVSGICIRLVRHWHVTSGPFHFWVLFLVGSFVLLWLSLTREKGDRLSWKNLTSLLFAILVLLAAEGALSA
jgi:hypothetical protein